MTSPHAALIYAMVLSSAADGEMTDAEMRAMGDIVSRLPAFRHYDSALLPKTAAACAELLDGEDGLEQALQLIAASLPPPLHETAYGLACEIVAADGEAGQEELRLLELLRQRLGLDRLVAAAIERGVKVRYHTA